MCGLRLGVALCVLLVTLAHASSVAGADEEVRETIRERMQSFDSDLSVQSIETTPVDGLYEVDVGGDLVYVSSDGRYVLRGELLDLVEGRNLTKAKQRRAAAASITELSEEDLIVYEPQGEAQHQVTVFTDIECPYCRRFHRQLDAYLERGIRIRYAFLPRGGRGSTAYNKAVAVWCADDPHRAMTRAKQGESIPREDCEHPVDEHLALANKLRVRGTPSILTNDGRELGGYVPPAKLASALDEDGS